MVKRAVKRILVIFGLLKKEKKKIILNLEIVVVIKFVRLLQAAPFVHSHLCTHTIGVSASKTNTCCTF